MWRAEGPLCRVGARPNSHSSENSAQVSLPSQPLCYHHYAWVLMKLLWYTSYPLTVKGYCPIYSTFQEAWKVTLSLQTFYWYILSSGLGVNVILVIYKPSKWLNCIGKQWRTVWKQGMRLCFKLHSGWVIISVLPLLRLLIIVSKRFDSLNQPNIKYSRSQGPQPTENLSDTVEDLPQTFSLQPNQGCLPSLLFASCVKSMGDAFASLKDDIQSDSELVEAMRVWEGRH